MKNLSELVLIVEALNTYRSALALQLQKEKSFTRYISHELRTPMTIIKGAISNIRQKQPNVEPTLIDKVERATDQMEALTQTLLLLARDTDLDRDITEVNRTFIAQICDDLSHTITSHRINFSWQLSQTFTIHCNPLLFKVILLNLLKNAFACSIQGNVELRIEREDATLVDDGVGLNAKPRNYDGFGMGLTLVEDICRKYGWIFAIENNATKGCCVLL